MLRPLAICCLSANRAPPATPHHAQSLLELMVGALYASRIELGPDNVEPVYRAAGEGAKSALICVVLCVYSNLERSC